MKKRFVSVLPSSLPGPGGSPLEIFIHEYDGDFASLSFPEKHEKTECKIVLSPDQAEQFAKLITSRVSGSMQIPSNFVVRDGPFTIGDL